jgi:hypothetical protein
MERRMLWWLAPALLLISVSLAVALMHDPVNKANWDRIGEGTTRAEVERMLGKPGVDVANTPGGVDHPGWRTCQWTGTEEWIEVQFDSDGFARRTCWHNQASRPGVLEDLARRAGIPWPLARRKVRPERYEGREFAGKESNSVEAPGAGSRAAGRP